MKKIAEKILFPKCKIINSFPYATAVAKAMSHKYESMSYDMETLFAFTASRTTLWKIN